MHITNVATKELFQALIRSKRSDRREATAETAEEEASKDEVLSPQVPEGGFHEPD